MNETTAPTPVVRIETYYVTDAWEGVLFVDAELKLASVDHGDVGTFRCAVEKDSDLRTAAELRTSAAGAAALDAWEAGDLTVNRAYHAAWRNARSAKVLHADFTQSDFDNASVEPVPGWNPDGMS